MAARRSPSAGHRHGPGSRVILRARATILDKEKECEREFHTHLRCPNHGAEEFISEYGSAFTPDGGNSGQTPFPGPAPASVNWVDRGMVTEVKLQAYCGSSWAYAVTDLAEANQLITGRGGVSLSIKELLDCVPNLGCGGGWPDKVGAGARGRAGGRRAAGVGLRSAGSSRIAADLVASVLFGGLLQAIDELLLPACCWGSQHT